MTTIDIAAVAGMIALIAGFIFGGLDWYPPRGIILRYAAITTVVAAFFVSVVVSCSLLVTTGVVVLTALHISIWTVATASLLGFTVGLGISWLFNRNSSGSDSLPMAEEKWESLWRRISRLIP